MENNEVNEVRLMKGQGLLSVYDSEGYAVAFIHCCDNGSVDIAVHPEHSDVTNVTVWGKRGKRGHVRHKGKVCRYTDWNLWGAFQERHREEAKD